MVKKNLESEIAKTIKELDLQTKREVAKAKVIGKTIKSDFETIILKQPELRSMKCSAPLVIGGYETLRDTLSTIYKLFSDRELSCTMNLCGEQLDLHAATKFDYLKKNGEGEIDINHLFFSNYSLTEKGQKIIYALKKIDGKKIS